MGEIADAMINGDMCEQCGVWLGDGDGYPRNCGCDPTQGGRINNEAQQPKKKRKRKRRKKKKTETPEPPDERKP